MNISSSEKNHRNIKDEILQEYIDLHFNERTNFKENNQNYQKQKNIYISLYTDIDSKLDSNGQIKLSNLIEALSEMNEFDVRYIYKLGLLDGISLKHRINFSEN